MTALYKQSMSFSKGLKTGGWLITGLGLYGNGKDIYQTCSMNDVISEACGRSVTKNISSGGINVLAGVAIGYGLALVPVTGGLSIILTGIGAFTWGIYGGDLSDSAGDWVEEKLFD